ncbi:MAG: hypothetical protein AB1801_14775, partial [Chloroflexota bacterium]
VDIPTLEKFLELVNATGNFGLITDQELFQKMGLLKKYIPETSEESLLIVAELLGIYWPMPTKNLRFSVPVMEEVNH